MPKLSVITINYNNCNGLKKTIESVVNQTCKDFEYIVIDGGSTDGSVDVIKEYADRINYWVSEPDKGIYNAMNKGVLVANGEYIQFLNSGDCLLAFNTIEEIISHLYKEDLLFAGMRFSDTQEIVTAPEIITMRTLYERSLPHPSAYIRRNKLLKFPYDETLRVVSDWKFWIQSIIYDGASYRVIPQVIVDFETTGISSTNKSLVLKERETVLHDLLPERVLDDYFHFLNGDGYQEDTYDKLFIEIRNRRYRGLVYTTIVCLMRFIALFKKSARFIHQFPMRDNL